MLLGFQPRFAPYIVDGSKQHTIRAHRKRGVRIGETCHCYVGLRQPNAKLLGRWPCVKLDRIQIYGGWEVLSGKFFGDVYVNDSLLDEPERQCLAYSDGFRGIDSFGEMMEFWRGRLPFEGLVIHWRWACEIGLGRGEEGRHE